MPRNAGDEIRGQVVLLYREWARDPSSIMFQRELNGLFEIAKEIDGEKMGQAFVQGTAAARADRRALR